MRIVPPAPGSPRRPTGPKDPGDAWVVTDSGERYWGVFGAAGLLAVDPDRGVLLQHRVGWSHFGGTWGIPGGALHQGETALDGALRESAEEAAVPRQDLRVRCLSVLDKQVWCYTTLLADVVTPFEPAIGDQESLELRWVRIDELDGYDLHPGFGRSWPVLRQLLDVRPVLVLDTSSVLDPGVAERVAQRGIPGVELGLQATTWFPEVVSVAGPREAVEVTLALAASSPYVTLVGDDLASTDQLVDAGARVRPGEWLTGMI
ncbi:NUDIX domain-containing protein [Acidipropionibacterium jensenii]|uniref:NUDIX domain-containing protein n=1 Tax=Acidipropionibacterium jensenii TaxID=1749 RepID=UPI00214AEC20